MRPQSYQGFIQDFKVREGKCIASYPGHAKKLFFPPRGLGTRLGNAVTCASLKYESLGHAPPPTKKLICKFSKIDSKALFESNLCSRK